MKLCRIKFQVFLNYIGCLKSFVYMSSGIDKAIALLSENSCDHSYETFRRHRVINSSL